ncbi:hypothetical protein EJ08DRAFT_645478 [Tothia fuscella]|uniref:Secreted protein n=1 Tax=Tothia fuscella TaxID=1048955 RepID=A0A9P4P358_9PEZI|nr:hypothetical protein EJ08DRAFT_645478 [Tothia fuscella]
MRLYVYPIFTLIHLAHAHCTCICPTEISLISHSNLYCELCDKREQGTAKCDLKVTHESPKPSLWALSTMSMSTSNIVFSRLEGHMHSLSVGFFGGLIMPYILLSLNTSRLLLQT